MTHSREAGTEQMTARATKHEFRPMIMVMTCNAENKFVESNIRIEDANRKVVISYPGKEQQTIIPTRTIKKSTADSSTTYNSSTETSPLEKIEKMHSTWLYQRHREAWGLRYESVQVMCKTLLVIV